MKAARLLSKQIPSISVAISDTDDVKGFGIGTDALACGRTFEFAEICEPTDLGEPEDAPFGYQALPFAVAGFQRFPTRCSPEEAARQFVQAFTDAAEYQVGHVLWNGDGAWSGNSNLFLTSAEVATTNMTGSSAKENIAILLSDAFEAHPELDPILHLGMHVALQAGVDLDVLDIPFVTNPAYPIDGVAVTGPIRIALGTVQDLSHVDWKTNRRYAEGTRLGLIEFDPCLARRGTST